MKKCFVYMGNLQRLNRKKFSLYKPKPDFERITSENILLTQRAKYKCKFCNLKFRRINQLKEHTDNVHIEDVIRTIDWDAEEDLIYLCELCDEKFVTRNILLEHAKIEHEGDWTYSASKSNDEVKESTIEENLSFDKDTKEVANDESKVDYKGTTEDSTTYENETQDVTLEKPSDTETTNVASKSSQLNKTIESVFENNQKNSEAKKIEQFWKNFFFTFAHKCNICKKCFTSTTDLEEHKKSYEHLQFSVINSSLNTKSSNTISSNILLSPPATTKEQTHVNDTGKAQCVIQHPIISNVTQPIIPLQQSPNIEEIPSSSKSIATTSTRVHAEQSQSVQINTRSRVANKRIEENHSSNSLATDSSTTQSPEVNIPRNTMYRCQKCKLNIDNINNVMGHFKHCKGNRQTM